MTQQNITLNLAILPYCNHPKFEKTCPYCKDAQRVYTEIKQIQQKTSGDFTKVQVLSGTGGNK
jgi:hypothetical protein